MAIKFDKARYTELSKTYDLWWERKLDRPLLKLIVHDAYEPEGEKPVAPLLDQSNCHDFSYSAKEIIEAYDYELSKYEFLGDSFPMVNLASFGPGVTAAFCGARLDNSTGAVWFFPEEVKEISDIHIKYDPENKWVKRIKEIYKAGNEKWQGQVIMSLPDLSGVLDIVAVFCETENLLINLYDEPEEVDRLRRETEIAWDEAYRDLAACANCDEYGYTDWSGLYSKTPSFIVQCDFSYMISNEMFKEFVLPSIEHHCETLDHVIYHLDGIGEIKHLDTLLALEKLDAIQWVSGTGQPGGMYWYDEVHKKIADAGKGNFLGCSEEDLAVFKEKIDNGLYCSFGTTKEELPKIKSILSLK